MVKRYPAIDLVAKWGRPGALVVSLLAGLVAVVCYLQAGSTVGAVASAIVAVVLWGALRLGAEMIEMISDTLLPR